jgi:hypothetical protein
MSKSGAFVMVLPAKGVHSLSREQWASWRERFELDDEIRAVFERFEVVAFVSAC